MDSIRLYKHYKCISILYMYTDILHVHEHFIFTLTLDMYMSIIDVYGLYKHLQKL